MTLPRAYLRKFESGFTLLEVLVVIGALAFVFAILTIGIRQAIGSFALRRAASITAVELRRAQAAAIAAGAGSAYTVEFVGGTGGLRVYVQGNASPVRTIAPPDEWPASVAINLASTTFLNCTAPASVTSISRHRLTISKSRCDVLADLVAPKDRIREAAEKFAAWLGEGEAALPTPPSPPTLTPEQRTELAALNEALPEELRLTDDEKRALAREGFEVMKSALLVRAETASANVDRQTTLPVGGAS